MVCLLYIASVLHIKQQVELVEEKIGRYLGEEVRVVGLATESSRALSLLQGCRAAIIVIATGGTEHIILDILDKYSYPVLLIAHNYSNSLPSLLEVKPLLRGKRVSTLYVNLDKNTYTESLKQALVAIKTVSRLVNSRFLLIGNPSPWLVYSTIDKEQLREKLGVEIMNISIEDLVEIYNQESNDIELTPRILKESLETKIPRERVPRALKLYRVVKDLLDKYKADIASIACFDIIPKIDTTACLALSLLNTEGRVIGCEGDVPAALTMSILSWISNKPAFIGNITDISDDYIVIAHCTAPMTYGRYRLLSHYESGRGVGLSVEIPKNTDVTIARLSPNLDRIRVLLGRVAESGILNPIGCRTQIKVKTTAKIRQILDESIGNHYVLVPGVYLEHLRHTASFLNMILEEL